MYAVCIVDMYYDREEQVAEYETYADAVAHADSIATVPRYNVPDPDGVYVTIYDHDHDSPRYTSW